MKRSKKRVAIIGGAGAAALLTATFAVRAFSSEDAAPAVALAPAREIVGPGLVEGVSPVVELAFEQSGRVAEVLVFEGQEVVKGQVLARLDTRIEEARVARAEAGLRAAQAQREAARSGARPEEIAAALAEAEAARADAENVARDRARAEALAREGAAPRQELDHARAGASISEARVRAARARVKALRNGARDELKRVADEAVRIAEADVEEARALLAQREVRAPMDGVVVRRLVEPGQQVFTTAPRIVFAMADVSQLRLRVEIDEQDVARLSLGSEGYAQAAAFGDRRFPGRVVRITPSLGRKAVRNDDPLARNDTRVLEVLFELAPGSDVPLGLRMDVHVGVGPSALPQS